MPAVTGKPFAACDSRGRQQATANMSVYIVWQIIHSVISRK